MWFDYSSSFFVDEDDFEKMLTDIRHGVNFDKAFDYWRITLDDEDQQEVLYVEDKIKDELRRRLGA